jgi:serine/threonine protein kinase
MAESDHSLTDSSPPANDPASDPSPPWQPSARPESGSTRDEDAPTGGEDGAHDSARPALPDPGATRDPGATQYDRYATQVGDLSDTGETSGTAPWYPSIDGYEILSVLGEGGMGIVYRARQLMANRLVALKMVRGEDMPAPGHVKRFRVEAEAIARLRHPNIVRIYDVGDLGGVPYFSLELLEGGTLKGRLAESPMRPRDAAALLATLARGVQAAHRAGIVHRDLKPANILFDGEGTPMIADFGLAKRLEVEGTTQTITGQIVGTPSYMAPEQALGENSLVGPRADVYALGAILYETLTGRPPFRGATASETILMVAYREPLAPSALQPRLPRDLETICLKCLAKPAVKRYVSAEALAEDLERFLAGEPILARPTPVWERAARWARRHPAAATFLAISLIPCGVLTALTLSISAGSLEKSVRQTLMAIADAKAARLENYISERRSDLIVLGRAPYMMEVIQRLAELRRSEPPDSPAHRQAAERTRLVIESFAEVYGYKNALLLDVDGNVLHQYIPRFDVGSNLLTGPMRQSELAELFDRVRTLLQVDLSDYQVYPGQSEPVAFIAGPVADPRGRIIGYLALELGNQEVFQVLADNYGLGETGETVVASREGDEMWYLAPTRLETGAMLNRRVRFGSGQASAMERAVRGQRGYGEATDYRGVRVMAVWSYLPSYRWGLVVKQDLDEALALTRRQSVVVALLLAATASLVIIVELWVARKLTRPVNKQ